MSDTTAKIRAKGCENTGLDEELARRLHDGKPGKHLMAIVELRYVQPHGPDTEGKRAVDLVITQLEPTEDSNVEEHLRNLQRQLYYERQLAAGGDGQLQLNTQSDVEPTVEETLLAGKRFEPHDYVQDPAKPAGQGCDTCGKPEFAKIHDAADRPDPSSDEGDQDDDVDADDDAPEDE